MKALKYKNKRAQNYKFVNVRFGLLLLAEYPFWP